MSITTGRYRLEKREKIEQAIDACYDAILAPASWPDALHQLTRSLDATCVRFYPRNPDTGSHDPRNPERPVLEMRIEGNPWAVPRLNGKGQEHFSRDDKRLLERIAPHFRRMIRFAEKLAAAQAEGGLATLERTFCAAILLDWRGLVVSANPRAEALLGGGLTVAGGRLVAADRTSNINLQRLIATAVAARSGSTLDMPGAVAIKRAQRQPLIVDAVPTTGLFADTFQRTRALLVLTDPEERPYPSHDRICAAFGLTPAEVRLAASIASGRSVQEAAEALGITRETARSRLKVVFRKTGTGRQGELVALLAKFGGDPRR